MTERGGGSIRPGGLYHIISRFVGKQWFMEGPVERRAYLALLGGAIAATDWRLIAYALMSSHIHFAFVVGKTPLATWMQPIHTEFARWTNDRLERIGGVFVKGPNVVAYRPESARQLIQYIHCNPVRAGVVKRPGESNWTSHLAYEGRCLRPRWLDVATGRELVGHPSSNDWLDAMSVTKQDVEALRLYPPKRRGRRPARITAVANPPEHEDGAS